MLRKIAEAAAWLDEKGLYAEADTMTDVLLRYASQSVFTDDPDSADADDPDPYAASFAHDVDNFDLTNPEHMDMLRGFNPELAAEMEAFKPQRAKKSGAIPFGLRSLQLPPGYKTPFEPRIQEFFMTPEQIQQNKEAFERKLGGLTQNRSRRRHVDLDYASTSGKPLAGRAMVHDPHAEEVVRGLPKYQSNPNSILFDRDMLRAIFDPKTDVESLDPEVQSLVKRVREGRPSLDEDGAESTPYSLAEKLDFAARQIRPERVLRAQGRPLDVDPETGKKIRPWYLKLPKNS